MEEVKEEKKTQSQEAAELYSKLCHDAGQLQFQIKTMEGDLEDLNVKIRNARLDYVKKKKEETTAHMQEATEHQGVTQ